MAGVDAVHGTEQLAIALKMLKLFDRIFLFPVVFHICPINKP